MFARPFVSKVIVRCLPDRNTVTNVKLWNTTTVTRYTTRRSVPPLRARVARGLTTNFVFVRPVDMHKTMVCWYEKKKMKIINNHENTKRLPCGDFARRYLVGAPGPRVAVGTGQHMAVAAVQKKWGRRVFLVVFRTCTRTRAPEKFRSNRFIVFIPGTRDGAKTPRKYCFAEPAVYVFTLHAKSAQRRYTIERYCWEKGGRWKVSLE